METAEEQQYAQVTACAFTGHRPTRFTFKYDEAHPDCIELKEMLAKQIDFLYRHGVTDFYTGCALGVDMWAGEAVLSLMELHPGWMQLLSLISKKQQRITPLLLHVSSRLQRLFVPWQQRSLSRHHSYYPATHQADAAVCSFLHLYLEKRTDPQI